MIPVTANARFRTTPETGDDVRPFPQSFASGYKGVRWPLIAQTASRAIDTYAVARAGSAELDVRTSVNATRSKRSFCAFGNYCFIDIGIISDIML